VLDAGEHVLVRLEVGPLETMNSSGGEQFAKEQVLAAPLDASSPTLIASDIDHWREGPVDARARGFERRRLRAQPVPRRARRTLDTGSCPGALEQTLLYTGYVDSNETWPTPPTGQRTPHALPPTCHPR